MNTLDTPFLKQSPVGYFLTGSKLSKTVAILPSSKGEDYDNTSGTDKGSNLLLHLIHKALITEANRNPLKPGASRPERNRQATLVFGWLDPAPPVTMCFMENFMTYEFMKRQEMYCKQSLTLCFCNIQLLMGAGLPTMLSSTICPSTTLPLTAFLHHICVTPALAQERIKLII